MMPLGRKDNMVADPSLETPSTVTNSEAPPGPADPLGLAIVLWAVLALAVAVKCYVSPVQHMAFPKFAAGAEHWWAGKDLYSRYENLGLFVYSPVFAVFMAPFNAFGLRFGGMLWAWTNIAFFVWGVYRALFDFLPSPSARKWLGPMLILVLPGTVRAIWNQQSHPLVAAFVLLGASAAVRKQFWVSAGWLALAIHFKLSPIVVAALFAALWPGQFLIRIPAMLLLIGLTPFYTRPPHVVVDQYAAWFKYLWTNADRSWPSFRDAWSLVTLIYPGFTLFSYRLMKIAAAGIVFAWCLIQRGRVKDQRQLMTLVLAAGLSYMMLFGPAVEFVTYPQLAPFTAWGLLTALDLRLSRAPMIAAWLMTGILGFGAIERSLVKLSSWARAMLPVGTLLYSWWLTRFARHLHRASLESAHASGAAREIDVETLSLTHRSCPLCKADGRSAAPLSYSTSVWRLKVCASCGFVYLENPPSYADLHERLSWDKQYEKEKTRRRAEEPELQYLNHKWIHFRKKHFRRDKLAALARSCIPPGRICDVGCGRGKHLLTPDDHHVVVGIEVSPGLAQQAAAILEKRGGFVVNADALAGLGQFDPGTFSGIIMRAYLEHEAQPLDVLMATHRALAADGRLIIKVPNYSCLSRRIRGAKWCGFRLPDHVNYFTPASLRAMLTRCGFRVVRMNFSDSSPLSDNMWVVAGKA